jgi:hypothetical protein
VTWYHGLIGDLVSGWVSAVFCEDFLEEKADFPSLQTDKLT